MVIVEDYLMTNVRKACGCLAFDQAGIIIVVVPRSGGRADDVEL